MEVILHCSDSSFGNAVMIDTWHAEKGFKNSYGIHIGYHFVILNGKLTGDKYNKFFDGLMETGRAFDGNSTIEWNEQAAATLGANDKINGCLIGKSGEFTENQIATLKNAAFVMLKSIFGTIEISQHSDHDPINRAYCAGFTKKQMDDLRDYAKSIKL